MLHCKYLWGKITDYFLSTVLKNSKMAYTVCKQIKFFTSNFWKKWNPIFILRWKSSQPCKKNFWDTHRRHTKSYTTAPFHHWADLVFRLKENCIKRNRIYLILTFFSVGSTCFHSFFKVQSIFPIPKILTYILPHMLVFNEDWEIKIVPLKDINSKIG